MKHHLLLSIILLFSISSCKNKKEAQDSSKEESAKQEAKFQERAATVPIAKNIGGQLVNKYWKAIEIMGVTVQMPEGMKQEPYLKFSLNGTITANGGCNSIYGNYELGVKNFIEIFELIQTEKECAFENYDNSLVQALKLGKQYVIYDEDRMELIVGKRAPLAIFKAVYF